nr:unnamed protein product [Spirometra erinaceieuropaei]
MATLNGDFCRKVTVGRRVGEAILAMSCDSSCFALVIGVLLWTCAYIGMIVGIIGVAVLIINGSEVEGLMEFFLAILGTGALIVFVSAIAVAVVICSAIAANDDDDSANEETNA